jgi:YD repeat-containing protein
VTYTYDDADKLHTVIPQGSTGTGIAYDNDSRRQTVTLPNGVTVTYG